MANLLNLPPGVHARALTVEDIDDVVAMVNACEMHDAGETMWERADVLADIGSDRFDVGRDWVGVFEDGPIGWGLITGRTAWVDVHPSARGRGIGAALREWSVARAREKGFDRSAQIVNDRLTAVATMLREAGYSARYTSWILRMDHPTMPAAAEPPAGIELRAFRPRDETQLLTMFEQAFSEFDDRLPSTMDTWRAMTVRREGFRNEDMVVADDGDRVVGGAFLIEADGGIWVDKLAVDRAYRHRGIARALLHTAFRRSFELGSPFTELNTDSRTGALSLYERMGMYVRESYTNWALALSEQEPAPPDANEGVDL
jgi:GNAT superfamily N-acetyltransferase